MSVKPATVKPATMPITIAGVTFDATEGVSNYVHKIGGSAHLRVTVISHESRSADVVYVDARGDEHVKGALGKFVARVANGTLVASTFAPNASRGAQGSNGIQW